jgi:two-component system, NtrC family, response regulator AtoC
MEEAVSEEQLEDSRILIIEDDRALGKLLEQEVRDHHFQCRLVGSAEQALSVMSQWMPDLIVSDLRLPGMDGFELLKKVGSEFSERQPDFLIITAFGTISKAVETLKAGAEDFLTKPLDLDHFMICVNRILRNRNLRQEISRIKNLLNEDGFEGIIGQSRPMRNLFNQITRVARAEGPVLILGESGTGKELVARAIHRLSSNCKGSFLAVNCAGIPEHLLESEFFGHKAGAFTGAGKTRRGLFAEAKDGTLLLDEISEMPLALQVKLLRMLQDGKVRPVGADQEEQVNVHIVAATHQDIENEVSQGNFRQDLFFRLETFSLKIPPLRDRDDDLELLAGRFLSKFSLQAGRKIHGFDEKTLNLLKKYPFPGNVRELKNAIERAVTFCDGKVILPRHLPARIREHSSISELHLKNNIFHADQNKGLPTLLQVEQDYIKRILKITGGNKRKASAILGINRRTLYRRLDCEHSSN